MAIGTGWAEGAWVDAAWVTEAWDDVPRKLPVAVDRLLLQGDQVQHRASGGSAHIIFMESLQKEVDFIGSTTIYIGLAAPGTFFNAADWQIKRIDFANDGDITQLWAEGDVKFDNIWDNRASLTYI